MRVYQGGALKLSKPGISKLSWRAGAAIEKNVALTWKVRARNARGAGPWSASRSFKVALAVGDVYGGGRVAYILRSGDPGYVAGETHGLIAAAQGLALGTGRANTTAIVGQTIDNQTCIGGAAYVCDNLVAGEYAD